MDPKKVYYQARLNHRSKVKQKSQQSIAFERNILPPLAPRFVWKSMTGERWEQFLATHLRQHGYKVETTKTTGDQGVDLIVYFEDIRLAIQAKGYTGSVGNSAVQQAVAGKIFYNCSHCAVIINSRFTKSAKELAEKSDCILIDEDGVEHILRNGLKSVFTRHSV
jgi:HJR/Mrr/RecB family endonuclease